MKQAKDFIIFPLDVPSLKEAKQYVKLLSGQVGMFKVGLELFIRTGPAIINFIKDNGAEIFLDLKLHDIPVTVSRAMRSISDLNVTFATVHCGESEKMLKAAVEGSGGRVGVLGVTVLTSVSGDDIHKSGYTEEYSSDMTRLVIKRARMAKATGFAGIVCSGLEVKMIKEHFGKEFVTVTPGIRPTNDMGKDDQQRVVTPGQAVKNGSDFLVIGRPIRDAKNPEEAAGKIAEEIANALLNPVGSDTGQL